MEAAADFRSTTADQAGTIGGIAFRARNGDAGGGVTEIRETKVNPGTIIIRADASVEIGAGHVMRCLALAQAWQDRGGTAIFALARSTPSICKRITFEGFQQASIAAAIGSLEDAQSTAALACSRAARWIIVDGYKFDAGYQEILRSSDAKLALVDDFGRTDFSADLILNQNLGACEDLYAGRSCGARFLLGTRFALLRREFAQWRENERTVAPVARTVLVTMGGTDPSSFTAEIFRECGLTGLKTFFLVGGSARFPFPESNAPETSVIKDERNVPGIMAQSDIAIICAGGTLWESLFMGCATLSYARNRLQRQILDKLQEMGAAYSLGAIEDFDSDTLAGAVAQLAACGTKRKNMAVAGRQIVDGGGSGRVVEALQDALLNS